MHAEPRASVKRVVDYGGWAPTGVILFPESRRKVGFLSFCVVGLHFCISGKCFGTPHLSVPLTGGRSRGWL